MGTQPELRELVRDAIANDYEEMTMIVMEVTRWAGKKGLAVDQPAIEQALRSLVEADHAHCYNLGSPVMTNNPPPLDGYHSGPYIYYLLTPAGKAAIRYD